MTHNLLLILLGKKKLNMPIEFHHYSSLRQKNVKRKTAQTTAETLKTFQSNQRSK